MVLVVTLVRFNENITINIKTRRPIRTLPDEKRIPRRRGIIL